MDKKLFVGNGLSSIGAALALCLSHPDGIKIKGMSMHRIDSVVFGSNDSSPIAKITADDMFTGYEHHGFFTIGVLPIEVVENVRLRIFGVEGFEAGISGLQEW